MNPVLRTLLLSFPCHAQAAGQLAAIDPSFAPDGAGKSVGKGFVCFPLLDVSAVQQFLRDSGRGPVQAEAKRRAWHLPLSGQSWFSQVPFLSE
jgi:hypothetical protein